MGWRHTQNPLLGQGEGKGKSGGVRVIYYWMTARRQIYALLIYPKNKKDTLTDRGTNLLRELVKELLHG